MSAFTTIPLEDGEVIVIGPVTFSSSSSMSFSAGGSPGAQVSQTQQRKIGITNQRVIIESSNPRENVLLPNSEVKRIYLKRERVGSQVEKLETVRGQTLKLNLRGLNPRDEAQLFELFPHAEIGEKKGLFGGFSKLTPRPLPAPRAAPPPPQMRAPAAARPAPAAPATLGAVRSHIDDPDVHSLEDLRRYYPLAPEYDYAQAATGDYVVERKSDGAQFPILLEEEMLGFDVPVQDPKRKKVTVEVFKQK